MGLAVPATRLVKVLLVWLCVGEKLIFCRQNPRQNRTPGLSGSGSALALLIGGQRLVASFLASRESSGPSELMELQSCTLLLWWWQRWNYELSLIHLYVLHTTHLHSHHTHQLTAHPYLTYLVTLTHATVQLQHPSQPHAESLNTQWKHNTHS